MHGNSSLQNRQTRCSIPAFICFTHNLYWQPKSKSKLFLANFNARLNLFPINPHQSHVFLTSSPESHLGTQGFFWVLCVLRVHRVLLRRRGKISTWNWAGFWRFCLKKCGGGSASTRSFTSWLKWLWTWVGSLWPGFHLGTLCCRSCRSRFRISNKLLLRWNVRAR